MCAEIADRNDLCRGDRHAAPAGRLFYDGDCRLCCRLAARWRAVLGRRGIELAPLDSSAARPSSADCGDGPTEMRVVLADGRKVGGADAVVEMARRIWWAWPLVALAMVPGVTPALRFAYRSLARHRHCIGGTCYVRGDGGASRAWIGWLPLIVLPATACALAPVTPPWGFMWLLAFAIYAGCKWLMWWRAPAFRTQASFIRSFAWLIAWPGMDPRPFLQRGTAPPPRPPGAAWSAAITKTVLGALVLWLIGPLLASGNELALGWIGMAGTILLLHLGIFHLVALAWQRAGVEVRPLFDRPAAARSLGEFWGLRWNLAFRTLAHELVFRPLIARVGVAGATMAVFAVSGLVHDLVISLPAGAGFGLPTAYFLLQGLGVLAERSQAGVRLGLRRGVAGRVFAMVVIAAPAFWLFHPTFVLDVFVPFLRAIGAA